MAPARRLKRGRWRLKVKLSGPCNCLEVIIKWNEDESRITPGYLAWINQVAGSIVPINRKYKRRFKKKVNTF